MLELLELSAVILGFAYLIFISFSRRIAWVFGIVSSLIYSYLAYSGAIYLQAALQFSYVLLGIYGFVTWGKKEESQLKTWGFKRHLIYGIPTLLFALILGFVFSRTDQKLPYLDAFITAFAILATYLTTQSILENWIYWIILNLLSMYLWAKQGLDYTVFLSLINSLVAVFGFVLWSKKWKSGQVN